MNLRKIDAIAAVLLFLVAMGLAAYVITLGRALAVH